MDVEYTKAIERIIDKSKRSKYSISKEYGNDISKYIGRDFKISTLLRLCELTGYSIGLFRNDKTDAFTLKGVKK